MTGWEITKRVASRWNRDDVGILTASVAYYGAISLFPALMILTSGLGLFFRWTNSGQDAQSQLLAAIADQISPELRQSVEAALAQVADHAGLGGPVGGVMLLMAALAIFSQFERAFAKIWQVENPPPASIWHAGFAVLTQRLRAFGLLVGLGLAIIAVFVSEMALDTFRAQSHVRLQQVAWLWWTLETSLGILLNAVVFTVLYRTIPRIPMTWSLSARGGLFAAGCWELGRQLLSAFVVSQHYASAYGVIGALMAIMLWGYYAIAVVFLGAEYIQVLRECREASRADDRHPLGVGPTSRRVLDLLFALCILYVGSFLILRETRSYPLPQFTKNDPRHRVVVFSPQPDTHQVTLNFYAPLIEVLPGRCYYPEAGEMQALLKNASSLQESTR